MTAERTALRVRLPPMHPGQLEVARHPARFRILAAGRRWGKTRLGALLCLVEAIQGRRAWWVAPTYKMARVGWREATRLAAQVPGAEIRRGELVVLLPTGGEISVRSADRPDTLRGEGLDFLVLDEAAYADPETWSYVLRPALSDRRGRALLISTPKGLDWFHDLHRRGTAGEPGWAAWQFPTSTNPHIPPEEIEEARRQLPELVFRQEYLAEFVQEIDGALWSREWFERPGFYLDKPRSYRRIVVGVDPNASNTETSDEMGIIVRGLTHDNHIDLLADYTLRGTVRQRAAAVVRAFHDWNADCVVLEVNNGGDWIPAAIEHIDPQVAAACRTVHATRGKLTRAEPDASKCEKGEVHHVGRFPELENELTTWVPGMPSPNRLDAYVWAGWELMKRPGLTTDEQYQFAMV